jgi:hypothetical protein
MMRPRFGGYLAFLECGDFDLDDIGSVGYRRAVADDAEGVWGGEEEELVADLGKLGFRRGSLSSGDSAHAAIEISFVDVFR